MKRAAVTPATEQTPQHRFDNACPLILDFDETLLRPNFLSAMAFAYIKPNPLRALAVLWWLANSWRRNGQGGCGREIAAEAEPNYAALPVND